MKLFYNGDYRPEIWYGNKLLYSTLLEDDLRSEFNITIQQANSVVELYTDSMRLDKFITNLQTSYRGEYYITDWGDGTLDNLTSHTYRLKGNYTIKTHYLSLSVEPFSENPTILVNSVKIKINYSIFKEKLFVLNLLKGYAAENDMSLIVDDTTSFFNLDKGFNEFPSIVLNGHFKNIDFGNINTSNMTELTNIISANFAENITGLDKWDTSNVTDMNEIFYWCHALTSIDLSNFNTSNVTNMSRLFSLADFTSLDLSSFDTSNVIAMNSMITDCSNLLSVNLSSFNTSKVTSMNSMFSNCKNLTSLDLSNFDTSNVIDMGFMFSGCSSLTSLDLSNFDTSKVIYKEHMFRGVPSDVDWNYDGTNYKNFTLTEEETGFSGTFPWNQE